MTYFYLLGKIVYSTFLDKRACGMLIFSWNSYQGYIGATLKYLMSRHPDPSAHITSALIGSTSLRYVTSVNIRL